MVHTAGILCWCCVGYMGGETLRQLSVKIRS